MKISHNHKTVNKSKVHTFTIEVNEEEQRVLGGAIYKVSLMASEGDDSLLCDLLCDLFRALDVVTK